MSNLPSSTSFQGVLDTIIRSYLLNELPPEVGESNGSGTNIRHTSAERDLGQEGIPIPSDLLQNFKRSMQRNNQELNNNGEPIPGTSAQARAASGGMDVDQEYIMALYQCFEKRGVFKELQTFLRHKLVSILQDEFPSLQQSFEAADEQNVVVFRVIEDFLRCHRLLYTLSVLASESDVKPQGHKVLYGKLNAKEAEDLLDDLGIRRNSRLNRQVIKCYFDNEHFSLLESMHYLGIWFDGTVSQQLEMGRGPHENISRKESGHSIFVSKSNGSKTSVKATEKNGKELDKEDGNVERKLVELERKFEQEKEEKVRETIDRFKSDEIKKLRDELEAKMRLQIIEKEKEHLLELQTKLADVNHEINQERQEWLHEKMRQEKEMREMRKEIMLKPGKSLQSPDNSSPRYTRSQDDSCCRRCKQKVAVSSPGESPIGLRYKQSSMESMQADKLAFLQYKLEQQDEEIKSLRRQLILSPFQPTSSKPKKERKRDGRGDAEESSQSENSPREKGESSKSKKVTELESFLQETKKRMEKLDVAVVKVDEIVQEVFSKKRAATPLSTELSARINSAKARKKVLFEESRVMLYPPGIYNIPTSQSQLPVSPIPTSTLTPLNHQQLPEKQKATELRNIPSYNNFESSYQTGSEVRGNTISLIAPITSLNSILAEAENKTIEYRRQRLLQQRPETPENQKFPVAYGNQNDLTPRTRQRLPPKESKKAEPPPQQNEGEPKSEASSGREKVEESLFMAAIAQSLDSGRGAGNLQEKAIRHGALMKEKVISPPDQDDDENSKSISISESIKLKMAYKSKSKEQVLNNISENSLQKSSAFTKSTITDSSIEPGEVPVKKRGQSITKLASHPQLERRQSALSLKEIFTKTTSPPTSVTASSSSSGTRRKAKISPPKSQIQQEHSSENDNQSSLSISAPKSPVGDDDDFWKL